MVLIEKFVLGTTRDGNRVDCYTLKNDTGMEISIITYGGAITSCIVPDKNGNPVDVVLGYDNINAYEQQDKYVGALVGRHANRIAKGRFILNGKEYQLYCNDGNNHLHGGKSGFDKKIWNAKIQGESLILEYFSKDNEENYPGNLSVTVMYSLEKDNTLCIDYTATCDKDTVCSMTNHAYFNLSGHDSGSVQDQEIQIFADYYTPANDESLPTGEIASVQGTPMDLRNPVAIGQNIDNNFDQLKFAGGFDHNWVINDYDKTMRPAATAFSAKTGIIMKASTDLPGIQFYSGNFLDSTSIGKSGAKYHKRCGFCLETQYFPNSLANPSFEQPILKAGELSHHKTTYQFSTQK